MFELTDTLTYAVPIMLAVLVAKTVADALEPKGIYDLVIELNGLPYLDYKHEYTWDTLEISDVISRDLVTIRLDEKNTVQSLGEKLLNLVTSGAHDSGFPILRKDITEEGMRLVGYIGTGELEHALSASFFLFPSVSVAHSLSGVVADHPSEIVHFQGSVIPDAASSISSVVDHEHSHDPFDFTRYMDQAPLTLSIQSPLEMLHRFFVKLGARYVVVVDENGLCKALLYSSAPHVS